MHIEMSRQAKKYLLKCDSKTYKRLEAAIDGLATFDGDIARLQGREDAYRLKKSPYRIIFTYTKGSTEIYIEGIYPRGDVYKKG